MTMQFRLPDLGEGVKEGQVIKVLVSVGDEVREDQPLMEVETDKAAVEIPCPYHGTVTEVRVSEGQVVNVGDVMMAFETGKAAAGKQAGTSSGAAASGDTKRTEASAPSDATSQTAVTEPKPRDSVTATGKRTRVAASPAVRKRARELNIDLTAVNGSGPGGRVTRDDIERVARDGTGHAGNGQSGRPSAPSRDGASGSSRGTAPAPMPASTRASIPEGEDGQDQHGPTVRHSISQARKTIAANMTTAWTTIPHVTDSDDADVTELDALRKGYPCEDNGHRKVTMLAFVIRAVARALRLHPAFNAHFDADNQQIVYKKYINVAVGVHTQRGLVAPVIRDADQMNVMQIADALDGLTDKARSASFSVNDTRGGTYTISNAGAFGGSHYSTPIVTPGQCAVLAIGKSRTMPWVVDGEIRPRLIMPLSHSFDHRVADGGEEIAFLRCVIDALEQPARLLM